MEITADKKNVVSCDKTDRTEQTVKVRNITYLGSSPQFFEQFSVNLARSAKIDNNSVQSGERSDFSHKIIKSND